MSLKLGKKDPTYDKRDYRWSDLRATVALPSVPSIYGHGNTFSDWGMLGNDNYGDCVWAGFNHENMNIANLAAGGVTGQEVVKFTDKGTLSDYASTGFNPETGENDNGTEVREGLKYRQATGTVDSTGKRHKIDAYSSLEPGNLEHILQAAYIFFGVGIGFQFPASAMDQFNAGKPWSVVSRSPIEGGHYVPIVGRPVKGYLTCITWGKRQLMTEGFYKKYCDEAWTYTTKEEINKKTEKNWDGYAWKELTEWLKLV